MSDWISDEVPRVLEQLRARLAPLFGRKGGRWKEFSSRLDDIAEDLFRKMFDLYGWRYDFTWQLEALLQVTAEAARSRPKGLRRRDREETGAWLHDPRTVWASTYAERFGGTLAGVGKRAAHLRSLGITHLHLMPLYATPPGRSDGGYAVSDYRRVGEDLGTMEELIELIEELDRDGVRLVLDFVANHTADDHRWAEAAKAGDPRFQAFYLMYDDRTVPDRVEPHLRDIFPDRGRGAFTWRPDVSGASGGKWVWTTFHEFQWDLDYRNPEVLQAMAGELLHIANLGPAVIRMDATPFLWKEEGTTCENLPQAHTVLQVMALLVRLVAPSVELLSEAIVHPDDVVRFVSPAECRLGYNPLVMALTWEALATRDVRLLADALDRRSYLPQGCQWISYLRCHDDIGWGFADEDAHALGIDPDGHRRFLNAFYSGEYASSFARGLRFQEDPETGDARISGTLASLAGLEAAIESADPQAVDEAVRRILAAHVVLFTALGIPLLYLGDEVGQLNDRHYLDDPLLSTDNRWAHRPRYDWAALAAAEEGAGPAARILAGVRRLVGLRAGMPELAGEPPVVLPSGSPSVLAYLRAGGRSEALVVVNLAEDPSQAALSVGDGWLDSLSGEPVSLELPLLLAGYEFRILRREL